MKSFILLFLIALLSKQSAQQNNSSQPRLQTRIVGGKPARPEQFPYHVGVFADNGKCSGTIISSRHILTAAHCLINNNTGKASSKIFIVVGTNIIHDVFYGNVVTRKVIDFISLLFLMPVGGLIDDFKTQLSTTKYIKKHVIKLGLNSIVTHKDYNSHTASNDIGVIVLPEYFTFDRYINIDNIAKLPSRSFSLTGHEIVSTGWGKISDDENSYPNVLLYMTSNVVPENECTRKYGRFDSKIQICINSLDHSTCLGDSGGPNVVEQGVGRPIVVGIASSSSLDGCTKNDPQVLTRVSSYLDWIHENTGIPIEN